MLRRLHPLRHQSLTAPAALWPAGRGASGCGHRAAHVLHTAAQDGAAVGQRRLLGLRGAMTRHHANAGALAPAVAHFLQGSRRAWPRRSHA